MRDAVTPDVAAESPRQAAARRSRDHRARRRAGEVVVPVAVAPADLDALERLGLLPPGSRDPRAVGRAVAHLLAVAPGVALIGEALSRPDDLPAVPPGASPPPEREGSEAAGTPPGAAGDRYGSGKVSP